MHALLRHLEDVGFAAAPRVIGSGLDRDGREVLTFIDGEFTQPGPWSLDGAAAVGRLLRDSNLTVTGPPGSPGHIGRTVRRLSFLQVALDGDLAEFRQLRLGEAGGGPHAAPGQC